MSPKLQWTWTTGTMEAKSIMVMTHGFARGGEVLLDGIRLVVVALTILMARAKYG